MYTTMIQNMTGAMNQAWALVRNDAPSALAALGVIVVGWLLAVGLVRLVRKALSNMEVNKRFGTLFGDETENPTDVENYIGRGVFFLALLAVAGVFFYVLGMTAVVGPFDALTNQVVEYGPALIAAALLAIVAWCAALAVRFVVHRALTEVNIDERFRRQDEGDAGSTTSLSKAISETVYWLTLLLFVPVVLQTAGAASVLAPIQGVASDIVGYLPNVFSVAVILALGWFVASVVRRVVTNLLVSLNADGMSQRVGLAGLLGTTKFSALIGLVTFIAVLIPVLQASLTALQIDSVTSPAIAVLDTTVGALPGIGAAVLVVGIAYFLGRLVAQLVTAVLTGIGFDRVPAHLGIGKEPAKDDDRRTLSQVAGTLVLVAIMLFAVLQALPMMGFSTMAELTSAFLAVAGTVVMGLVIFALGSYLAKLAADSIRESGVAQADVLAVVSQAAILVTAGVIALQQMGVAHDVILMAAGLIGGAIAVAAAIALGIGGRDAAKRFIDGIHRQEQSTAGGNGRHGSSHKAKPAPRVTASRLKEHAGT